MREKFGTLSAHLRVGRARVIGDESEEEGNEGNREGNEVAVISRKQDE